MNRHIRTVIVAPMTSRGQDYPTRVTCEFQSKRGQVVLDQIRTVDKSRLVKRLGEIDTRTREAVLEVLLVEGLPRTKPGSASPPASRSRQ